MKPQREWESEKENTSVQARVRVPFLNENEPDCTDVPGPRRHFPGGLRGHDGNNHNHDARAKLDVRAVEAEVGDRRSEVSHQLRIDALTIAITPARFTVFMRSGPRKIRGAR